MKVDSLDNSAKAKTSLMKVKVKGIRIVHYITVYMGSNLLCPCKNCVQWAAYHIQYLCELGLSNCGFPTSWLLCPHNHDFHHIMIIKKLLFEGNMHVNNTKSQGNYKLQ